MAYSNSIITAPVSIYDVQRALGESSGDLGTLCKSNRINKWSKYKPMSINKMFNVTNADRASAMYGMGVPTLLRYYELFTNGSNWSYNKPTGGSTSPYRIEDFVGYYSAASCPFYINMDNSIKSNGSKTNNFSFSVSFGFTPSIDNTNTIGLGDALMSSALDGYFTVIMRCGEVYYMKSADNTINNLTSNGQYGTGVGINMADTPFYNYDAGSTIEVVGCIQPTLTTGTGNISNSPNMICIENNSDVTVWSFSLQRVTPAAGLTLSMSVTKDSSGVNASAISATLAWTNEFIRSSVSISAVATLVTVPSQGSPATTTVELGVLSLAATDFANASGTMTKSIPISNYTNWSQQGIHGSSSVQINLKIGGSGDVSLRTSYLLKSW